MGTMETSRGAPHRYSRRPASLLSLTPHSLNAMTYTAAQSALTFAIQFTTVSAVLFFTAAIATDLLRGFNDFRAAKASEGIEQPPAKPQSVAAPESSPVVDAPSVPAVAPVQPAQITEQDLAEFHAETKANVIQLFAATKAVDKQTDLMKLRVLEGLSVKQLRSKASEAKMKGRSAWKTKKQLIAGIMEHEAQQRHDARQAG